MSSLKELQDLILEKYKISPAQLEATASMREHGLDSLALAELLFEIEDRLGIEFPGDDPGVETLGQLAELVDRIRAQRPA